MILPAVIGEKNDRHGRFASIDTVMHGESVKGKSKGWKVNYSKFMIFWAMASHVWLIVQSVKIYRNQNAAGVSLPAFMILLTSSIVWLIYGAFVLERRNKVIVISSSVSMLLGIPVLVAILKY
jgi:uncharacterized protein with PQ loop repeat